MEKIDSLPNGWLIWQDDTQFKFTLDAVLLAAFPILHNNDKIIELGAGTGAVSMLLASRCNAQIDAIDINPNMVNLLNKSILLNNLEKRVHAFQHDIRKIKLFSSSTKYNVVIANPPYRKAGHGRLRQGDKQYACHDELGTTVDFIKAAHYLLTFKGKLFMVHIPERLPEIINDCINLKLEPKTLRFVHSSYTKNPSIFLLEAVKGAKQGLQVMPPLFVYDENNNYSEELLHNYQIFGK